MTYIIISSLILLSIFLYLIIELKASIHLFYIIPLTLFFIAGSYFYFDSLFGYPVIKTNEKKFRLISYLVNEKEEKIYFWIIQNGENSPKAVFIGYNKGTHEQLEKAANKLAEGQQIEGEFLEKEGEDKKSKSAKGTLKSAGGELILYDLNVKHYLPDKNAN